MISRLCNGCKHPETELSFIGIAPTCSNGVSYRGETYPFSYSHIIASILKESQKGDIPGSLAGRSMEDIVSVILKFLTMFRGFEFDQTHATAIGLHAICQYFSEPDLDLNTSPDPNQPRLSAELQQLMGSVLTETTKSKRGIPILDTRCSNQKVLHALCTEINAIASWWQDKSNLDISAQSLVQALRPSLGLTPH